MPHTRTTSRPACALLVADDNGDDDDCEDGAHEQRHQNDHLDVTPLHVAFEGASLVLEAVGGVGEDDCFVVDILQLVCVLEGGVDVGGHHRLDTLYLRLHVCQLVDAGEVVEPARGVHTLVSGMKKTRQLINNRTIGKQHPFSLC